MYPLAHNDRGEAPGGALQVSRYVPTRIFCTRIIPQSASALADQRRSH